MVRTIGGAEGDRTLTSAFAELDTRQNAKYFFAFRKLQPPKESRFLHSFPFLTIAYMHGSYFFVDYWLTWNRRIYPPVQWFAHSQPEAQRQSILFLPPA